jgi:hypothetical protein
MPIIPDWLRKVHKEWANCPAMRRYAMPDELMLGYGYLFHQARILYDTGVTSYEIAEQIWTISWGTVYDSSEV